VSRSDDDEKPAKPTGLERVKQAAKRLRLGWLLEPVLEPILGPISNRAKAVRQAATQHRIGQDLRGGHHALAYLRHLARGNRLKRRAFYETVNEEHPPVLLIHGFLGTRGSMWPLEQRLGKEGIVVFSFNLGTFNSRDIRTSAFLIHRKIEAILAQTNVKKIDIIGHSMGGLIGLYYVKKLGGAAKVRKLVMMGTPARGTWVALAGVATIGLWSASSWQLLPRSRFLRELEHGPLPPEVQVYTLAADRDWVCPPSSTEVPGATPIRVSLGHSSLVVSEEVFQNIVDALREPDPGPDGDPSGSVP
jgi:triacylglycerol esterase/lipase EstA (alpha/beta hydrolase family)